MLKVELNKKTTNPFYGLKACLNLYQNGGKAMLTPIMLNEAWKEVQEDKDKRQMFFALLFSIGDITARQHNIFKGQKVDSGGNAQRSAFTVIMNWLKTSNYPQFKRFLFANLFNEYTSFDSLFANRVRTKKGKGKDKVVEAIFSNLSGSEEYLSDLSDFVVSVIRGNNPSNKHFLAKFLTRPRTSKRSKHKKMLAETRSLMKAKEKFLKVVCDKAGMAYRNMGTHIEFTGYITWRKQYIGDLESVLFSSKKILEFDEQEFMGWLDKLPASARYRVRTRLLNKDNTEKGIDTKGSAGGGKYGILPSSFLKWEKFKETKQTEQRVLEEKQRQGLASEEDIEKLQKVKKEAKVTVGAVSFDKMFTEIVTGTVDKIKLQPFLDKVSLPYNTLVFVDDSGSMRHGRANGITAFDFATFMATICLTKNPDDIGRSLIGFFSASARLYSTITARSAMANTLLRAEKRNVSEQLLDPNKHFLENLTRIREFANAVMTSNYTNLSSIPDYLYQQVQRDEQIKEQLLQFPVWTIISDGNWNNLPSPEASIADFFRKCEMYLGYKPFIIAIDVASNSSANISRFSGIDNFMYIPPNPAQIEQLLTNFKDMDIMDVYTPLQSLFRSNRYDIVKAATI